MLANTFAHTHKVSHVGSHAGRGTGKAAPRRPAAQHISGTQAARGSRTHTTAARAASGTGQSDTTAARAANTSNHVALIVAEVRVAVTVKVGAVDGQLRRRHLQLLGDERAALDVDE